MWLQDRCIEYKLSAEYSDDLIKHGFKISREEKEVFMLKCVFLGYDEDILSMVLSLPGVTAIQNSNQYKFRNKIRKIVEYGSIPISTLVSGIRSKIFK